MLQALAHRHAAAKLPAGAVRPGRVYRRLHLQQSGQLQGTVLIPARGADPRIQRLSGVSARTLHPHPAGQVTEYIHYTERLPLTQAFFPPHCRRAGLLRPVQPILAAGQFVDAAEQRATSDFPDAVENAVLLHLCRGGDAGKVDRSGWKSCGTAAIT